MRYRIISSAGTTTAEGSDKGGILDLHYIMVHHYNCHDIKLFRKVTEEVWEEVTINEQSQRLNEIVAKRLSEAMARPIDTDILRGLGLHED